MTATSPFRTELLLDPDEGTLLRALSSFSATLERGDEVAFFFAGHGVEIGGRNYLLPADIPNVSPGQELVILRQSLPLSDVIDQFAFRGVRLSVLFIDACRDNPFQLEEPVHLAEREGWEMKRRRKEHSSCSQLEPDKPHLTV
jgi:uncharacterized caspase-like protein